MVLPSRRTGTPCPLHVYRPLPLTSLSCSVTWASSGATEMARKTCALEYQRHTSQIQSKRFSVPCLQISSRQFNSYSCLHLDRGRGSGRWVAADLTAVLIWPLLVVELQLLGGATVVVPDRLHLLGSGLTQQLTGDTRTHTQWLSVVVRR